MKYLPILAITVILIMYVKIIVYNYNYDLGIIYVLNSFKDTFC